MTEVTADRETDCRGKHQMVKWLTIIAFVVGVPAYGQQPEDVAQLIALLRERDQALSTIDVSIARTHKSGRDVENYWNAKSAKVGAFATAMRSLLPVPGGVAPRPTIGAQIQESKAFYRLRRLPPDEFRVDTGVTDSGQSNEWSASEWKAGKEWWWFTRGDEPHVTRGRESSFSEVPYFALGAGAPMAQQLELVRKLETLPDWLAQAEAEERVLNFEPRCEFEGEPCVRVTLVRPNHVGVPQERVVDRVTISFATKRGGAPVHLLCELGFRTDKGVEVGLITRGFETRWIDFVESRPKGWIPSGCRLTYFEDLAAQPSADKKEPERRRFEVLSDEYEITARQPDPKEGPKLGILLFDAGTIIQNDFTEEVHRLLGRTTVDGTDLRERIE